MLSKIKPEQRPRSTLGRLMPTHLDLGPRGLDHCVEGGLAAVLDLLHQHTDDFDAQPVHGYTMHMSSGGVAA